MMLRHAIARAFTGFGSTGGEAGHKRSPSPSPLLSWLCIVASAALAALALMLFEISVWRALLVAILLACSVGAVVAYVAGLRPLPFPVGAVPATPGHVLNWIAPYYDAACRLLGLGSAFRRHIIALAAIRPGNTVLDVGCGTGVLTRLAARAVGLSGISWGIDPAPDMIRIALIKGAEVGNAARFKPGIIEDLEFGANIFDVVLICLVLHHLPPELRSSGLKEVARVLKPGGHLVVIDFDLSGSSLARRLLWPLRSNVRIGQFLGSDMIELLRACGFDRVVPVGRWGIGLTFWMAHKLPGGAGQ